MFINDSKKMKKFNLIDFPQNCDQRRYPNELQRFVQIAIIIAQFGIIHYFIFYHSIYSNSYGTQFNSLNFDVIFLYVIIFLKNNFGRTGFAQKFDKFPCLYMIASLPSLLAYSYTFNSSFILSFDFSSVRVLLNNYSSVLTFT